MAHSDTNGSPEYGIAAVERALVVAQVLARFGPASLSTVAEAAGCTRTAAFRLLRTLETHGYAMQSGARGAWRLGPHWGTLGRASAAQGALAITASPFLAELSERLVENVTLKVRDGVESEVVAVHRAQVPIRLYDEVGTRRPLHAGAGRLLLAFAPSSILQLLLSMRLPRYTPATRVDQAFLESELPRIGARGWLVTQGEVHEGAVSISVAVRDATTQVVAALVVISPATRLRPERAVKQMLPEVQAAAGAMSARLGYAQALAS